MSQSAGSSVVDRCEFFQKGENAEICLVTTGRGKSEGYFSDAKVYLMRLIFVDVCSTYFFPAEKYVQSFQKKIFI